MTNVRKIIGRRIFSQETTSKIILIIKSLLLSCHAGLTYSKTKLWTHILLRTLRKWKQSFPTFSFAQSQPAVCTSQWKLVMFQSLSWLSLNLSSCKRLLQVKFRHLRIFLTSLYLNSVFPTVLINAYASHAYVFLQPPSKYNSKKLL